jgi:hypothetical protein
LKFVLFVIKVNIGILEERVFEVKVIVVVSVFKLEKILFLDIGWTEMSVIDIVLIRN